MFFRKKKGKEVVHDKYKQMKVGNYSLLANYDHSLEFFLRDNKYYSSNLPRIAKLIEGKYPNYSIVDVGANIGDTIALLRTANVNQLIYCIEGEPEYYEMLKKNKELFSNVQIIQAFLGEETGKEKFNIDTSDGTAKLKITEESDLDLISLNELANSNSISNVKLLKIDTDGFDLKIMRGGFEFIKENFPVLFFEYDASFLELQNEDPLAIFPQLQQIGYNKALFYDNYGKLVMPVNLQQIDIIEHLYRYIKNKDGAFEYYDICIFHQQDDDLAINVFEEEKKFFN